MKFKIKAFLLYNKLNILFHGIGRDFSTWPKRRPLDNLTMRPTSGGSLRGHESFSRDFRSLFKVYGFIQAAFLYISLDGSLFVVLKRHFQKNVNKFKNHPILLLLNKKIILEYMLLFILPTNSLNDLSNIIYIIKKNIMDRVRHDLVF